jgi:mitochondrial fission protein ELM1
MSPDSWILTEPYAGLQAQALGLAEAAGLHPATIDLHPRPPLAWLPPVMWPMPLRVSGLRGRPEGVLFTAGGSGAAVGAALRKRGRRVVQVQHPRMDIRKFDLVVANAHDQLAGPNVIVVRHALHRARPDVLAAARQVWAPRFAQVRKPLVAVLIGGSNGRFRLGLPEAEALGVKLAEMAVHDKAGIVLTTSRRTAPEVRGSLKARVESLGGWVWDGQGENPYYGMLACADAVVVTIDSISMISEAIATAAPVMLAELPGRSRRNRLFLKELLDVGRVRHFVGRMDWWPVVPMDDTRRAGMEVRRWLGI